MKGKLKCNLSFFDSLGFIIGWMLLSIITFGLATPFFVFSLIKYVINRSIYLEEGRERKLSCNMSIGSDFFFIAFWSLLSIVTCGIAAPFFFFSLIKYAINKTEVV